MPTKPRSPVRLLTDATWRASPKSQTYARSVLGDEDVARFHVSVDEPRRMCRIERLGYLVDEPDRSLRLETALAAGAALGDPIPSTYAIAR